MASHHLAEEHECSFNERPKKPTDASEQFGHVQTFGHVKKFGHVKGSFPSFAVRVLCFPRLSLPDLSNAKNNLVTFKTLVTFKSLVTWQCLLSHGEWLLAMLIVTW